MGINAVRSSPVWFFLIKPKVVSVVHFIFHWDRPTYEKKQEALSSRKLWNTSVMPGLKVNVHQWGKKTHVYVIFCIRKVFWSPQVEAGLIREDAEPKYDKKKMLVWSTDPKHPSQS